MLAIMAKGGSEVQDPDAFRAAEVPVPRAEGRDILVKVSAISINPVDAKVRQRSARGVEVQLGWDACGLVQAVGGEVVGFAPGDRVFYAGSLIRPGTYAEFHLVDERIAAKAPRSLNDAAAAAIPLTAITAFEALFHRLGFTPAARANAGRSVLVVGGAGGVGSMAVQLAHWAGLRVAASASRPESAQWCRELGADLVLDHRRPLAQEAREAGVEAFDAVFCTTHMEAHWTQMAEALRPQGAVALIDDPSGPLDLTIFKRKSARICWEFMFTRSLYGTVDMEEQGRLLALVADLLDAGELRGTATETLRGLSVDNIRLATARQEGSSMIGKQVVAFTN